MYQLVRHCQEKGHDNRVLFLENNEQPVVEIAEHLPDYHRG
jgi:hypothetical protein